MLIFVLTSGHVMEFYRFQVLWITWKITWYKFPSCFQGKKGELNLTNKTAWAAKMQNIQVICILAMLFLLATRKDLYMQGVLFFNVISRALKTGTSIHKWTSTVPDSYVILRHQAELVTLPVAWQSPTSSDYFLRCKIKKSIMKFRFYMSIGQHVTCRKLNVMIKIHWGQSSRHHSQLFSQLMKKDKYLYADFKFWLMLICLVKLFHFLYFLVHGPSWFS